MVPKGIGSLLPVDRLSSGRCSAETLAVETRRGMERPTRLVSATAGSDPRGTGLCESGRREDRVELGREVV
jgi:hypothetical protein